jgi:hypothetical protein
MRFSTSGFFHELVSPGSSVVVGIVDTGDKFITGVKDTSEQLSPVTRTRTPWRWGAAKDRRLPKLNNAFLV